MLRHVNILRLLMIMAVIIAAGWVFYRVFFFVLPLARLTDIGCPSFLPETFEHFSFVQLPASTTHLVSSCYDIDWLSWVAIANFEMSPLDLGSFLGGTRIHQPLVQVIPPEEEWLDQEIIDKASDFLYGEADWGQRVFIDTSNPETYHVYLYVHGGRR
jgi:hypothetical protein